MTIGAAAVAVAAFCFLRRDAVPLRLADRIMVTAILSGSGRRGRKSEQR
jgi:hypothetical protein